MRCAYVVCCCGLHIPVFDCILPCIAQLQVFKFMLINYIWPPEPYKLKVSLLEIIFPIIVIIVVVEVYHLSDRKRGKEKGSPPAVSFPKHLQQLKLAQVEARSQNYLWVSHIEAET